MYIIRYISFIVTLWRFLLPLDGNFNYCHMKYQLPDLPKGLKSEVVTAGLDEAVKRLTESEVSFLPNGKLILKQKGVAQPHVVDFKLKVRRRKARVTVEAVREPEKREKVTEAKSRPNLMVHTYEVEEAPAKPAATDANQGGES